MLAELGGHVAGGPHPGQLGAEHHSASAMALVEPVAFGLRPGQPVDDRVARRSARVCDIDLDAARRRTARPGLAAAADAPPRSRRPAGRGRRPAGSDRRPRRRPTPPSRPSRRPGRPGDRAWSSSWPGPGPSTGRVHDRSRLGPQSTSDPGRPPAARRRASARRAVSSAWRAASSARSDRIDLVEPAPSRRLHRVPTRARRRARPAAGRSTPACPRRGAARARPRGARLGPGRGRGEHRPWPAAPRPGRRARRRRAAPATTWWHTGQGRPTSSSAATVWARCDRSSAARPASAAASSASARSSRPAASTSWAGSLPSEPVALGLLLAVAGAQLVPAQHLLELRPAGLGRHRLLGVGGGPFRRLLCRLRLAEGTGRVGHGRGELGHPLGHPHPSQRPGPVPRPGGLGCGRRPPAAQLVDDGQLGLDVRGERLQLVDACGQLGSPLRGGPGQRLEPAVEGGRPDAGIGRPLPGQPPHRR